MYGSEGIRTDKHGNRAERYPAETEHGRLLGITVYGHAAYATGSTARLAVMDDHGELCVPPRERWLAAEFPLAETGLSPGDYVLYVADEAGPWRVLAAAGREGVAARGVDPERVVAVGPADAEVDALIDALAATDGWADRAEPAGELRQAALDHPREVAERLGTLLSLLSESVRHTGGTDPSERVDGTDGSAPPADGAAGSGAAYHGTAARCDVAWVLARAARAEPGAVADSLADLLELVAAGRGSDADADRHLLDALDVVGRVEPAATVAALLAALGAADPALRRRALDTLYRLEHRYATDDHPLLADGDVRDAVDSLASDPESGVRERAEEVRTVHGFHHGP